MAQGADGNLMLRPEFKRAYRREQRGPWWSLRRWWPARNRRYHERRMEAAFARVNWQCDGVTFHHAYVFVPEPKPARGGNLIVGGRPAHLRCKRCGAGRTIGISLDMRAATRRFREFTDGGPPKPPCKECGGFGSFKFKGGEPVKDMDGKCRRCDGTGSDPAFTR